MKLLCFIIIILSVLVVIRCKKKEGKSNDKKMTLWWNALSNEMENQENYKDIISEYTVVLEKWSQSTLKQWKWYYKPYTKYILYNSNKSKAVLLGFCKDMIDANAKGMSIEIIVAIRDNNMWQFYKTNQSFFYSWKSLSDRPSDNDLGIRSIKRILLGGYYEKERFVINDKYLEKNYFSQLERK